MTNDERRCAVHRVLRCTICLPPDWYPDVHDTLDLAPDGDPIGYGAGAA